MIGERLKDLRVFRGLSIDALAKASGVTKSAISHIERGLRQPRADTLLTVAEALGTTPEDLMEDEQLLGSISGCFSSLTLADRRTLARICRALTLLPGGAS